MFKGSFKGVLRKVQWGFKKIVSFFLQFCSMALIAATQVEAGHGLVEEVAASPHSAIWYKLRNINGGEKIKNKVEYKRLVKKKFFYIIFSRCSGHLFHQSFLFLAVGVPVGCDSGGPPATT